MGNESIIFFANHLSLLPRSITDLYIDLEYQIINFYLNIKIAAI